MKKITTLLVLLYSTIAYCVPLTITTPSSNVHFKFDGTIKNNTSTINITAPYLSQPLILSKEQVIDLQTALNRINTPINGLVHLIITVDPASVKLLQESIMPTASASLKSSTPSALIKSLKK